MFNSDTDHTITRLVDQVLTNERRFNTKLEDDGSITAGGMLIEVELNVSDPSIEDYDERMEAGARRFYYVVFCNNVSVFVARREVDDGIQHYEDIESSDWENTSNHDSCWRSDGMRWLSKAYFDMCDEVNAEAAPITLDASATIGFMSLWRDVEVNVTWNDEGCCLNSIKG